MRIRAAEGRADRERCAGLMAATDPWITLGRGLPECLALLEDPLRETHLAVAEDGTIEGFVTLVMAGAFRGYVQVLCVRPESRGRGVGSELLDFAEGRIFAETPNVFICHSSFNPRAGKLYESRGYRVVGELKDYVAPGLSEILMRKTTGPLRGFKPAARG